MRLLAIYSGSDLLQTCFEYAGRNPNQATISFLISCLFPRAPKANAFTEAWIGSINRECLNDIKCFSADRADYVVRTWVKHYNKQRAHRGKGMNSEILDRSFKPSEKGIIRRRAKPGGLINE